MPITAPKIAAPLRQALALGLAASVAACGNAGTGSYVAPWPAADAGAQPAADGEAQQIDAGVDDDAQPTLALNPPSKCAFGKGSCVKPCFAAHCAAEEAACDANEDCMNVANCVKKKCEWSAWGCINECIYKTFSAKGGNLYKALIGCAADKCIVQECGDSVCIGQEDPDNCPRDCRVGQGGAGTCIGRCGGFAKGAACQCDKICAVVGDCCVDHEDVCNVPDVAIIAVSGHDLMPPLYSEDYLSDPNDAVAALKSSLEDMGKSVKTRGFVDSFHDWDDNGDGVADRFGFQSLVSMLKWVHERWVLGAKEPATVVLLSHSHGAVWAHIALTVVPELHVRYLITLDGSCLKWKWLHADAIVAYVNTFGQVWEWSIWDPCDRWDIPGLSKLADTEDVVFDNVGVNLEVRSQSLTISDDGSNRRLDGSKTGIKTFTSGKITHSNVHHANSVGMNWVLEQLPFSAWQ